LIPKNLKNTTGNGKRSGSCVRGCRKSRKQYSYYDRPSHSVKSKLVVDGTIPRSENLCSNRGYVQERSRVKNNSYNRPETKKSLVVNEKKTRSQRYLNPIDITPTRPEIINEDELAKKICDQTNVFLQTLAIFFQQSCRVSESQRDSLICLTKMSAGRDTRFLRRARRPSSPWMEINFHVI
jgi:hypothetical protein